MASEQSTDVTQAATVTPWEEHVADLKKGMSGIRQWERIPKTSWHGVYPFGQRGLRDQMTTRLETLDQTVPQETSDFRTNERAITFFRNAWAKFKGCVRASDLSFKLDSYEDTVKLVDSALDQLEGICMDQTLGVPKDRSSRESQKKQTNKRSSCEAQLIRPSPSSRSLAAPSASATLTSSNAPPGSLTTGNAAASWPDDDLSFAATPSGLGRPSSDGVPEQGGDGGSTDFGPYERGLRQTRLSAYPVYATNAHHDGGWLQQLSESSNSGYTPLTQGGQDTVATGCSKSGSDQRTEEVSFRSTSRDLSQLDSEALAPPSSESAPADVRKMMSVSALLTKEQEGRA